MANTNQNPTLFFRESFRSRCTKLKRRSRNHNAPEMHATSVEEYHGMQHHSDITMAFRVTRNKQVGIFANREY
jgi:hypothetical protein